MSEAVAPANVQPAPRFPMDRGCPYHPPAGYEGLRAQGPLARVTLYDGRLVWLVTGHAEARALLIDPRLSSDRQNPAFPVPFPRAEALIRRIRTPLLGVDQPEHGPQRRMLIPSFSLKRIASMRPGIQQVVDGLLDALLDQGPPADLVTAFALPVPSMVICHLLGVPYADHEFFEVESRRLIRGPLAADVEDARNRLSGYLGALITKKEAERGDGLLDELITEQLHQGHVERAELISLAMVLLVAGHETTSNMISLDTLALLEHPEQLAALRADGSLMPGAVEELLRFLSIADGMARVATEDIEIDGQVIRAGEGVFLANAAINRDGSVFAEPDVLDVSRAPRHHLAFGYGIHQCLGQNLARAELEIALSSLFARVPGLRPAVPVGELTVRGGDTIQGVNELPVAW